MHIDQVLLSVFGDLSGLQTKYQSKTTMVHYAFEIEEKLDYYPMHLLLMMRSVWARNFICINILYRVVELASVDKG